jgi:REP element-mobilizing transposase RayT
MNKELFLNESGKMIEEEWKNLEKKYSNIILHDFVVMPNHFHGIIEIKNENQEIVENKNVGANLVFAQNANTDIRVNTRFTPT